LLDDADVDAAQKAPEVPAETPVTPPEPEKGKADGEFDRSASFREVMQSFEQYMPEDRKKAYKDRIEQGERWAASHDEVKEIKAKLADVTGLAKELAPLYEGGEEYLAKKGPIAFIKQWNAQYGPQAEKPEPTKPPDEETDQDRLARLVSEQVTKVMAPHTQELERIKTQREQDAAAKKFAADFDPRILEAVGKWNLSEEVKADVGKAFADFAQNIYMSGVYMNPDNPESVTVAASVAKAAKMIDTIVEARTAKRPAPPRPTVRPAGETSEVQMSAKELLDSLDVSDDIEYALRQGG